MKLPPDSFSSRVLWSVAALFIILLWEFGIVAPQALQFWVPYTLPEAIARIPQVPEAFWPGIARKGLLGAYIQLLPATAMICWAFCLVPWKTRKRRVIAVACAILVPAWWVILGVFDPSGFVDAFAGSWRLISRTNTGEGWEGFDFAIVAGVSWWLLLLPIFVMTLRRRINEAQDICPACAYPIGTSPVCTECGKAVARL